MPLFEGVGELWVNTRDLAKKFNRKHVAVLRDVGVLQSHHEGIVAEVADTPYDGPVDRFRIRSRIYQDSQNRAKSSYDLNFDAAFELVMPWRGKYAEAFRAAFLEMFKNRRADVGLFQYGGAPKDGPGQDRWKPRKRPNPFDVPGAVGDIPYDANHQELYRSPQRIMLPLEDAVLEAEIQKTCRGRSRDRNGNLPKGVEQSQEYLLMAGWMRVIAWVNKYKDEEYWHAIRNDIDLGRPRRDWIAYYDTDGYHPDAYTDASGQLVLPPKYTIPIAGDEPLLKLS
jgi:hypothetical protein